MFRRRDENPPPTETPTQVDRITSVLGDGTSYHGKLTGGGGVRIEGTFDGEITLEGLLVIGTTGRVTCENLHAKSVIVAGAVRGDITAEKVEIRASGRVWGNVTTMAFSTEEGAFLRGQIQMEEEIELEFPETGDPSVEDIPPPPEEEQPKDNDKAKK